MLNNIVENFKLIKKEIEAFLGINYVMAVHKLPAIKIIGKADSSLIRRV